MCLVGLVHMVLRMQEALAHVPVGREEQEPRRVLVEPADRKEAGIASPGYELCHAGATLGIIHRGQIALGLVKHEVDAAILEMHLAPIDAHDINLGIDLAAEFGHDLAVHAHATGGHEVLRSPAARDAGAREELLQAHGKRLFGRCV